MVTPSTPTYHRKTSSKLGHFWNKPHTVPRYKQSKALQADESSHFRPGTLAKVVSSFVTISKAFCSYQLNGQIESRAVATDSSTSIDLMPTDFEWPLVDAPDFTHPNTASTKSCPNDKTAHPSELGPPARINPATFSPQTSQGAVAYAERAYLRIYIFGTEYRVLNLKYRIYFLNRIDSHCLASLQEIVKGHLGVLSPNMSRQRTAIPRRPLYLS